MKRKTLSTAIGLTILCLSFLPDTRAVSPPPDGGYPGGNTAEGQAALLNLTTGGFNTAVGYVSLRGTTTASFNTAIAAGALPANIASGNTATGAGVLLSNTTGFNNTAVGTFALFRNDNGSHNTAIGVNALVGNTDSSLNTAVGDSALSGTTGSNNTALGFSAGSDLTTGNNNIVIGFGVFGVAGESNTIRIGNTDITDTFIRGISGATASGGAAVFVNGNGKLGTMTSSARFKDEIKPIGEASEAILGLKPVSFRYKKEIDPQRIPQFGLVAEDVEKVNPDLVIRDADGKPQTVRYEEINAMLLNEFLKEHKTIEELKATVEKQEAIIAHQQKSSESRFLGQKKRIDTLTSGLERMSAQLELSKSRRQTVLNNQ